MTVLTALRGLEVPPLSLFSAGTGRTDGDISMIKMQGRAVISISCCCVISYCDGANGDVLDWTLARRSNMPWIGRGG